ncbi:transmembrane protein with metallophosphoesterase domain-like [Physella acuta]|uniref:transmembrane protein with metallophosphoesterase domain-like n=1 Tax=Physella acuta TaxID=109671 RepID=UPI0027DAEC40|nr:transmembrane protein with metallophosphoesterase domain-like [Physella acuta]
MALFTRRRIFMFLTVLLAVIFGEIITIKRSSYETKAVIIRVNFIVVLEIIIFAFSCMIWNRLEPLITRGTTGAIESNNTQTTESTTTTGLRKCKNSELDLSDDTNRNPNVTNEGNDTSRNSELTNSKKWSIWHVVLLTYLGTCHLSYLTNVFLISSEPHWISLFAYACLGSFIQLNTGLVSFKLISVLLNILNRAFALRCRISKKSGAFLALIYTLLISVFGLYTASQLPAIKNVAIPVKDLPSALEKLTIVQLSDIHLGPTVGLSKLRKIQELVNQQNPDVVVLTGDLVDSPVYKLKEAVEPLSAINSKYGKYFVTGNHEYYTGDVDNWFSVLESHGFRVLHNSHVLIPEEASDKEGQICLAGTDDVQAERLGYGDHKFDLDKAVSSCNTARPVILLAHQPIAAKRAVDSDYRIDLVLSGHTHGGQLFPLNIPAYLLNPYFAGLYQDQRRGSFVYVSQGTQYWGIPMRIFTSMEITKLTLYSIH